MTFSHSDFSSFSYTFTILLTVLYLQQQRPTPVDNEKVTAPGHVEETVPDLPQPVDDDSNRPPSSRPNTPSHRSPSPPQGSIASSEHLYDSSRSSIHDSSSMTSWGATTLASDGESIRSNAHPAPATQQGRRWSTSTSSSYDANQFIVTDGFRPDTQPPAYAIQAPSQYCEPIKAA